MPSFDIVNKIDAQEIDNAVNNTKKEVETRYDFRGLHTEIAFDKKTLKLHLVAAEEMKLKALREMLTKNFIKRNISPKVFDVQKPEGTSQGHVKMDIHLQEGIDKVKAKQIVKIIKDLKLKVQPAIQEDQVRVTGKKIDDLQMVIQHLKSKDVGLPLQFVNIKK